MSNFDPSTGEVIEGSSQSLPTGHERAADGGVVQTVAHTGGNFLDMLGSGAVSHEFYEKLREVAAAMTEITDNTGTKTKGEIVLKVKLTKEGEHFNIEHDVKAKAPELPRPKAVMWQDESGLFTAAPPGQTLMYSRNVRRI